MFDNTAPTILQVRSTDIWLHLAFVNSRVFEYFVRLLTSSRHWQVGYLRAVPFPQIDESMLSEIERLTREAISIRYRWDAFDETSHRFHHPLAVECKKSLIRELAELRDEWERLSLVICRNTRAIDEALVSAYGLDATFEELLDEELETNVVTYLRTDRMPSNDSALPAVDVLMTLTPSIGASPFHIQSQRQQLPVEYRHDYRSDVEKLVSYAVGCGFGRWNLQRVAAQRDSSFDESRLLELDVCPPGMLQGPSPTIPTTPTTSFAGCGKSSN
jgi:hypothetical protein